MAARNFTGSARIRAAKNKVNTRKISGKFADIVARVEEIRALLSAALDLPRVQNSGVDPCLVATFRPRTAKTIADLVEDLGTRAGLSR